MGGASRIGFSMCLQNPVAKAETIEGQEGVAVIGDELDRREHEIDLGIAAIVRKRDASPSWLDAQEAAGDLRAVELAPSRVDSEQPVPVGPAHEQPARFWIPKR